MIVKLSLTQLGGDPANILREATLVEGRLVLGRSSECDWHLDDEGRVLSRKHCEFSVIDDRLEVEDMSSNGIQLNDNRGVLGKGVRIDLNNGDKITLGEYVVTVEINQQSDIEETRIQKLPVPPSDVTLGPKQSGGSREEDTEDTISQTLFLPIGGDIKEKSETGVLSEELADPGYMQAAMTAGMQAVLDDLFVQLDPDQLESQVVSKKSFGLLASGNNKAAAWDQFRKLYRALKSETVNLEESAVMDRFREGYEEHLKTASSNSSGTK
jgi:predicted component of type VI protein secretion system